MLISASPSALLRCFIVLLIAGALTACDSGSDDGGSPLLESSFSIDISGQGVDRSYSGNAYNGVIEDSDGKQTFAVTLDVLDESAAVTGFLHRSGTRPSEGTYALADIDDATAVSQSTFIFYIVDATDNVPDVYVANGGQVTITESTGDVVRGELSIPATYVELSPSGETRSDVQIDVSFTAVNNPAVTRI